MKKFISLFALILMFSVFTNVQAQKDPADDLVNFSFDGTREELTIIQGQFNDATSPQWNRPILNSIFGPNYDPSCNGGGAGGISPSQFMYEVFPIIPSEDMFLVATLETPTPNCCSTSDMMLFLYCDPFNAGFPLSNLRAGNDDDGITVNSAFVPGSNVLIEEGKTYYLVASHFGAVQAPSDEIVEFTLTYNLISAGPGIPITNWALGIGIFLIVAATLFRVRRYF